MSLWPFGLSSSPFRLGVCVIGTLRFEPVAQLVIKLRDQFDLSVLVEGGTYRGQSTSWAAEHFDHVVTIDIREDYQNEGKRACEQFNNITFLTGDTRGVLPAVVDALTGPAVFWLDAHSVKGLFGPADDCPLLEELDIINRSPFKHFILIDDAHCYIPPLPHDPLVWPELHEIEEKAAERGYLMWHAHDVLILAPAVASQILQQYTDEQPETINASALIDIKSLRRRLHKNLIPTKMTCSATAFQGVAPRPVKVTNPVKPIVELVDAHYGYMILPKYDTSQTPALRQGLALGQGQIDVLIDLIQHRDPGAVFIDVGANVGAFSFALRPYCAAVHAFEAQRILFNMLCGSVALNSWQNVYCYNIALSDELNSLEIPQFDYSKPLSFGSIEFGGEQTEVLQQEVQKDPKRVEFVTAQRLDDYLFHRVDMIKIDVEGMELQVLEGARDTICMYHPILLVEHIKTDAVALKQWLLDHDYKVEDIGGDYLAIPR